MFRKRYSFKFRLGDIYVDRGVFFFYVLDLVRSFSNSVFLRRVVVVYS